MKASNCRSCEAPIIWTRTRSGKKMPVDAEPVEDGTFYLVWDGDDEDDGAEAHHIKGWPEIPADEDRYTSHFATCPDAGKFRK